MEDPTRPLQIAIAAAIVTRLTTEGYSSPSARVVVDPEPTDPMPYVVLGNATVIPFRTKSNEGAECTHTFTAWATTYTESTDVADYALQAVTDRSSPLSVTGFYPALAILDFRGPAIRERAPGTDSSWYWGTPVRVRFKLIQD